MWEKKLHLQANTLPLWLIGDWDWGGQNVLNPRGGGELTLKVAPRRLALLTSKLAISYRNSVERGQFQGALKIQNFHPPSNFRRFDPPYPGLQTSSKQNSPKRLQEKKRWTEDRAPTRLTFFHQILGGRSQSLVRNLILLRKGAEVLETAVGAVFYPDNRFSLVRISIQDLVA